MDLSLPTPIEPLLGLSVAGAELWIKRDDRTSTLYGGNKARKLGPLLDDARAAGAQRLLTVGATGSHHVLATAIFGGRAGFQVEAVMVPQPVTAHVVRNFRAALAAGLEAHPTSTWAGVPFVVASRLRKGVFFLPVGGSTPRGARPYADAAHELAAQVQAGRMPVPDVVVVTAGSGGTAAGLAVGLAEVGLSTRVRAIVVSPPAFAVRALTVRLVARLARSRALRDDALARLSFDDGYLGAGYGADTPWGARARAQAERADLYVDATYTAKTFAAAVDLVTDRVFRRVLYWHTLSSASLAPWLSRAPSEEAVRQAYPQLLRGSPGRG